jgi:hypothetical protein
VQTALVSGYGLRLVADRAVAFEREVAALRKEVAAKGQPWPSHPAEPSRTGETMSARCPHTSWDVPPERLPEGRFRRSKVVGRAGLEPATKGL